MTELAALAAEPAADHADTLVGWFARAVASCPARPFLSILRGPTLATVTYRAAAERVVALVEVFRERGLCRGDRVVCYGDDHEPLVIVFLAAATAGVVAVPLGAAFSEASVRQVARRCGARAIVTMPAHAAAMAGIGLPVITTEPVPAPRRSGDDAVRALAAAAALARSSACYVIQPTSGSTGTPKLIPLGHAGYAWGTRALAGDWADGDVGASTSILLSGALTHGAGQFALWLAVLVRGSLCIPTGVDTAVDLAEVERLAASVLVVVPRVLRSLVVQHVARGARPESFRLPGLRHLIIGGAMIDEAMAHTLERGGVSVQEVYGSTETCFVALSRPGRRRPGYVGELLPGVDVRIAADGELLVRSPHGVCAADLDPADRGAFVGDHYGTGDLATIEDGYLRLLGRKRDVLLSAEGSYVYPAAIEEQLEGLPWVDQALLLGDGKPFIIALIVVRASAERGAARGYLAPEQNASLYQTAQGDVAAINERLDRFAHLRKLALFTERFPPSIYGRAAAGKVVRHRANALELYAPWIDALYEDLDIKP